MIGLDLVTLLVADVERAKRFYVDALGLEVVKDSRGYVELAAGGGSRLALFPRADLAKLLERPEIAEGGGAAPTVVSFHVEGLEARYEVFVSRGAEALMPPAKAPWGRRVAFLRDPDGNLVELADPRSRAPL